MVGYSCECHPIFLSSRDSFRDLLSDLCRNSERAHWLERKKRPLITLRACAGNAQKFNDDMDHNLEFLWLILFGFFAGGYGTLVGAGGGFIIAPALLLMYPTAAPETITSISLAVVFANALSGTLAYAPSKRID